MRLTLLGKQAEALREKLHYRWNLLTHYQDCPLGPDYQEAWNHRYELFSRWDHGIKTDEVGLYSVTPEKIAVEIAARIQARTIVDAFCGIGGSAIALAATGAKVYAIDSSSQRLDLARHNAGIYGQNRIEFIVGDALRELPYIEAEAVFLDPPWGGPAYEKKPVFRLSDFSPSGRTLLDLALAHFPQVILRTPAQFLETELTGYQQTYTIQPNLLHGRVISKTFYFGN